MVADPLNGNCVGVVDNEWEIKLWMGFARKKAIEKR
jgi:hypothetical protein